MPWREALRRDGILQRYRHHSLLYLAGLRPAPPPEYDVPGIVGLTFRLGLRPDGAPLYATLLDLPAAIRLGARLGLDPAASVAMVDSHERVHVALQLDYERLDLVPPEVEEEHSRIVDAAWLWCAHPNGEAALARLGGVIHSAGARFWEALLEEP